MNTSFRVLLRDDPDWSNRIGGWNCDALRIPGTSVECLWLDGTVQDPVSYSVSNEDALIRWTDKNSHPPEITVKISLAGRLYSGTGAAWIAAAAVIISALIAATATLLTRLKSADETHAPPIVSAMPTSTIPTEDMGADVKAFKDELKSAVDAIHNTASDEVTCAQPYIEKAADRNALVLRCAGEKRFYGVGKYAVGKGATVLATGMVRIARAAARLGQYKSLRRPLQMQISTEGTADGASGPIDPYTGPNVECGSDGALVTVQSGEALTNAKLGCVRAGLFSNFLIRTGLPAEVQRTVASRELLNGSTSGDQRLISVVLTIAYLGDILDI